MTEWASPCEHTAMGDTQDTNGVQPDLSTRAMHLEEPTLGSGILKKMFLYTPDLLRFGSGSYSLLIFPLVHLHTSLWTSVFVSFDKDNKTSGSSSY